MATQRNTTRKRNTSSGLGTAITSAPVETTVARHARLMDAAIRDLVARHHGYLLVRKHLDWALAECETDPHDERVVAGEIAAILHMRTLLQAEMERITAQARILEALRDEPAA